MTAAELVKTGEKELESAGIEDSKVDAWLLLSHVTGFDRTAFFMHGQEQLPQNQVETYGNLLEQRKKHIPLQYITGEAFFMGYRFLVNENVLIPRGDTEVLVEEALKHIKKGDHILDMCTGSGCILLSLLLKSKAENGVAVDISQGALEVAKTNASNLRVTNARFLLSNLFENVTGMYDVIVSNPPYIPSEVICGLMKEVVDHEPRLALDGHEDGLYFYEKITKETAGFLKQGGYLCYEIGFDQAQDVEKIMERNGFEEICTVQDFAGLDRVVTGRRR